MIDQREGGHCYPDIVTSTQNGADDREAGIAPPHAVSDPAEPNDESSPQFKTRNGWVVFDLPPDAPPLTNEMLDALEEADTDVEYRRAFSPCGH